jgi:pimeloyl-ACP methyl ester carboxylesterase
VEELRRARDPRLYYKPPARFTGKRPVVVVIHGGPEGQSRGRVHRPQQLLPERARGRADLPERARLDRLRQELRRLDNGEKREDSVKDIGALLDWIAAQPELDADRVMIMGGSYGGYMTLAASVHYADRIRCAVDIVGISNFVTFLEHTEAYRQDLRRVEYGDEREPKMRAKLQEISPLTHAAEDQEAAVRDPGPQRPARARQRGRADRRHPASGRHAGLVPRGQGRGPRLRKKRNQDYQMYATILFMQTYLLDGLAAPMVRQ